MTPNLADVRAALRADIAQIILDADGVPDCEPDRLDMLLGIDPNDTLNRLAAMAVQAREQRNDALRQVEASRKAIERWTDKANEAGAAYGDANTKHHAELDRANRLEAMCDRLAERLVERDDTIAAQAKAIADALALADHLKGRAEQKDELAARMTGQDKACNESDANLFRWIAEDIRSAITPDAPAPEAQAPNASAYRDAGRPLHSSSTEQED